MDVMKFEIVFLLLVVLLTLPECVFYYWYYCKRGSRGGSSCSYITVMECKKKSLKCLYEDKVILLRTAIFMPRSALILYMLWVSLKTFLKRLFF